MVMGVGAVVNEADSKVLEATNWRHECTGCDVCLRRQRFAIGLLSISDGSFERIEARGTREKPIHSIISKQSASHESTRTLVCLAPSFTSFA